MQPEASTNQPIDETARRRFEGEWQTGEPPLIEQFLPPKTDPLFLATLEELVHIDLEMGWKAAQKVPSSSVPRVEAYLDRFPALNAPEILLRLLQQEYHVRQMYGDRPSTTEYRSRFPAIVATGAEIETVAATPTTGADVPPVVPGYEVLEQLGRGGMGVVYKARHVALNRLVALKMIRGDGDPESIARFRIEAEAAARLHHANIVQVYEVGNAAGRPYLSLEFVPGGNLDRAVAGTPQPPRLAAATVERLARAIHAAHLAGILHRDLKPANVLLASVAEAESGVSGEALPWLPKVADFGLAKRLQDDPGQTRTGAVLGTPSYMAPEQAAGRKGIGRGADIYALGAILYHMLTGRPPFRAANTWDTITQVIQDEPLPPSRLTPRLPRDLETICLKCLRKEPERRYATAEELADDLRSFLRGEPVRARPVGLLERGWRWCRRESRVATLIALVVMVIALGAGVAANLLFRMDREATARLEADLRDIDGELGFIDREEFTLGPQMDETRRLLLEKLAKKCQMLTEKQGSTPALSLKKAEVYLRLGTIHQLLGRYAEAESAYSRAIDLATGSDAGRPTLARGSHHLATLFKSVGRLAEAEQRYGRAVELLSASETGTDARLELAETLKDFADLHAMVGRQKAAEESYRLAGDILGSLASEQPSEPKPRLVLGVTETRLGQLCMELSRFEESAALLDSAVARLERLHSHTPTDPVFRLGLARALDARARRFGVLNRKKEHAGDLTRAYRLIKGLSDQHPQRPDYRFELASVTHKVARLPAEVGVPLEALPGVEDLEKAYRASITMHERLAVEFPAFLANQQRLAVSLNDCATWLGDISSDPNDIWTKALQRIESLTMHRRSEEIWTRLATSYPDVIAFQNGVSLSHQRYGIVLEKVGSYDEAARRYREAIAIQTPLARQYPRADRHHIFLSALHNNLGVIADRRNDVPEAERLFRVAISHGLPARELNPANVATRVSLSIATANLSEMLRRQGRHQEAAEQLRDVTRHWRPSYWNFRPIFDGFRECVELAEKDATLTPDLRRELVTRYGDWTMEQVRLLVVAGREAGQPGSELVSFLVPEKQGLGHVRNREDFQRLFRELAAKPEKP